MSDGPPVSGEAAWKTDPTGRHRLRWFDGTRFTDQVADDGATASDPLAPAGAPQQPFPSTAPGAYAPHTSSANPALPSDVTGRKASRLPVILAAVGAFVVVLAMLALLRDDDGGGGGTGEFSGEVTEDDPGRHEVSVDGGSIVVVEVEPSEDLDVVVGFEVSDDDAERLAELFEDTAIAGATEVSDGVVFRRDVGFDGEDETTFLAVPFDVDATVVVSGFDGSEGDYDITIEAVDLDVEADADGDDVIDAVRDADGIPRALQRELDALLGD